MAQENSKSDPLRLATDPSKISAFDLIERNIMRDVETSRKTEFKGYETANNQNTFGGLVGRIGLETFEKYGLPATRVASYVNQAMQMAVDHHNYLVRREELNESGTGGAVEITFTARDISSASDRNVTLDPKIPVETVRLLTVSLMMLDADGGLEQSLTLKQTAMGLIERNVITAVEKTRRASFTTLSTSNQQNTFGGLTGRIGLETVARYRLSEARIKSYVNQAYQAAVDHHNFIARRESYSANSIVFSPLSENTDLFNAAIPAEVVRLIVLSYINSDNGMEEPRQPQD
jgi:hypothetical protein